MWPRDISNRTQVTERVGLAELWAGVHDLPRQAGLELALTHLRRVGEHTRRSPLTSLFTVLTIAIALVLFSLSLLVVENLGGLLASRQSDVTLHIFLKDEASAASRESLVSQLGALRFVDEARVISPREALDEFKAALGDDGSLLDGLENDNPIPGRIELTLTPGESFEAAFSKIENMVNEDPAVERVSYPRQVIARIGSMIRLITFLGLLGVGAVLLITGFLIANTIKLALYAHRAEVEILQLVGASRRYLSAPYLIEGLLHGLFGSLLALGIVYLVHSAAIALISRSEELVAMLGTPVFLSPLSSILVVLLGIFVGYGGSYIALRRYLIDEAPHA